MKNKTLPKCVALVFLLLLLAQGLNAANQPLITTWSSKIVLFAGYRYSDFGGLNTELQSAGLPTFPNPMSCWACSAWSS